MSIAIFCTSANEFQAETILIELRNAMFPEDEISVVFTDQAGINIGREQQNKAPQGAVIGAGVMAVGGCVFGLLAGMGVIGKTALNSFVTAGPVLTALTGIAAGAVAGAIIGAWIGRGIPEYSSQPCKEKIGSRNILISVQAEDMAHAKLATTIFTEAGAQDIAITGEAEIPAKRVLVKEAAVHAMA